MRSVVSSFTKYIHFIFYQQVLENIEGAIKNGQSRETGNIGWTTRRGTKQKHNTICIRHYYAQTNTNNVNKVKHEPSYKQPEVKTNRVFHWTIKSIRQIII
jgi:hypothetical protein